jgi:hypothetical protein
MKPRYNVSNVTSADTHLLYYTAQHHLTNDIKHAVSLTGLTYLTTADLDNSVAEHFWYICLLGTVTASLSYEWFTAICYKFEPPMYIQETIGDR